MPCALIATTALFPSIETRVQQRMRHVMEIACGVHVCAQHPFHATCFIAPRRSCESVLCV